MNNNNGVPGKAWLLLVIVSLVPLASGLLEKSDGSFFENRAVKPAAPQVPTISLPCAKSDEDYIAPPEGAKSVVVLVPPENCWTAWIRVPDACKVPFRPPNCFRSDPDARVWEQWHYSDGIFSKPFRDGPLLFTEKYTRLPVTARRYKNDGEKTVRAKITLR